MRRAYELVGNRVGAKAVAPALDVPHGGGGEVHRAAQGGGVAVAFEKGAASSRGLLRVVIDPHHEIRIARLDRRGDQIAGNYGLVAAAPGADREAIRFMTGGRTAPTWIID